MKADLHTYIDLAKADNIVGYAKTQVSMIRKYNHHTLQINPRMANIKITIT